MTTYSELSHRHCFDKTGDSPCGMKGEHRCCLCGKQPQTKSVEEIVEQIELITSGFAWWSSKSHKEQLTDLIRSTLHSNIQAVVEKTQDQVKREILDEFDSSNFLKEYAGCDEPCCGGCTQQVDDEKVEKWLSTALDRYGEAVVAQERERISHELLIFLKPYIK